MPRRSGTPAALERSVGRTTRVPANRNNRAPTQSGWREGLRPVRALSGGSRRRRAVDRCGGSSRSGARLGIVPFTASMKIVPANGFWVMDDRLVVAEDWHAEL